MSSPAVPRAVMRVASRKFCAAVRTLHTPQIECNRRAVDALVEER